MSAVACSACYGSGYGVDGNPCPCGCRPARANAGPPPGGYPMDRAIKAMPLPQYPIAPSVAGGSAYDQASILINRCKRILALVDTYVDCPTQDHRTSLRKALIDEFDAAASAPPVAEVETIQQARANFEDWYSTHAADIKAAPIGSRDSMLQWSSWIAARSGNYVARGDWKISPGPWGPAGAPVVAGIDTRAEMRAVCSACGGTGDVHSIDGEWRGQCTCVHAWRQRAEKAEGRAKELDARLARRSAPLSPETQQVIAAARAAGQSIAATPGGLVFMSDGAQPDYSKLDCPACGGSGHAGDVPAWSTP